MCQNFVSINSLLLIEFERRQLIEMSEEAVQAAEEAPIEAAAPAIEAAAEPETPAAAAAPAEAAVEEPVDPEDVSYQAVEKEGTVTAIWEMQGQKHLRTIDPRSHEGKQILALFETAG